MKKLKVFSVTLVVCLTLLTPMSAFAESATKVSSSNAQKSYEINTVQELSDVIEEKSDESGVVSKEEAKQIISATSPEVVEDYIDQQTENLKAALDEVEFTLEDIEKKEYEILVDEETGAKMHITLEDQEEPYEISTTASGSQNKTGTSKNATKAVGDRYFTGSCYYQSGFVTVRLFVENHYTVTSSLGLKERYLTFKEVQGFIYCDNTASKAADGHILTCNSVGSSIKYRIEVISKIGPIPQLGGNLTTKYYYADSSVKLLSKNTKNKTVNVTQSLKWNF